MINLALQHEYNASSDNFLGSFIAACEKSFGAEITAKWFANLIVFSHQGHEVIFAAQSKFVRDWIIREFIENKKSPYNLTKIAAEVDASIKKVSVICLNKADDNARAATVPATQVKVVSISKHDNVFAFGSELNPKYTFANFVSGKYNRLAVAMAKAAAGAKEGQQSLFDSAIPLYIHGGIGMGKTHLAQAIAWQIKEENKSKKVVYLSAEKFMYHFVQSVRSNETMSFKEKFRSIDVLIIDDVQFIAGKAGTQEEFMHTFNNLVENNKQVVLVCDRSPSDLEAIDEKLKSRISGGMILNFKTPDFADRFEILKAKTAMSGEVIDEKILELLASKINSSVRDIDGALRKLLANKIFINEEITLETARLVASEYSKASTSSAISLDKIQKIVAAHYEIKVSSLLSNTRARNIARPRQIAMYLAKTLTSESLPKIGREFGNKNHATVIYSVKMVAEMIVDDVALAREIKGLEDLIRS